MKFNILGIIFVVTQSHNLVKLILASTESSVDQFTDHTVDDDDGGRSEEEEAETEVDAIEIYKNFTDSIFASISELGENNTQLNNNNNNMESYYYDHDFDDGSSLSVASLIGVSYILAGTSQLKWSSSILFYPGFETVMQNLNWDILESLDTVLQDIELTLKCSNVLFLSTSLNSSLDLITGSKNSFEMIQVDFYEDDITVPIINDKISRLINTTGAIQQNYIPEGLLISSSTKAILFNVVETQKLKWSHHQWVSIGQRTFNKKEQVEMLQFHGTVQVIQNESEIQVFIFFENKKCGLALRMGTSDDRRVANIEDIDLATSMTPAFVQLPMLNYTIRSEYNFHHDGNWTGGRRSCDFEKNSTFLQLLDVLAHVHLGPEYFQLTAISAAQINNVEQYKEEELRHAMENFPKNVHSKPTPSLHQTKPLLPKSEDENPVDVEYAVYLDAEQNGGSSENQIFIPPKEENMSQKKIEKVEEHEDGTTNKGITFDRPFTWIFFDDYRVPIVAGVVTSFKISSVIEDPPADSFLGMEGSSSKNFPYIQC